MRCSNTRCGIEGDGNFCGECGSEMVTVVICSGKLKDGSPCGSELVPGKKFCENCGTKVQQALSTSIHKACPECGKVLDENAKFCMECGYKVEKPTPANKASEARTVLEVSKKATAEGNSSNNNLVTKQDGPEDNSITDSNKTYFPSGAASASEQNKVDLLTFNPKSTQPDSSVKEQLVQIGEGSKDNQHRNIYSENKLMETNESNNNKQEKERISINANTAITMIDSPIQEEGVVESQKGYVITTDISSKETVGNVESDMSDINDELQSENEEEERALPNASDEKDDSSEDKNEQSMTDKLKNTDGQDESEEEDVEMEEDKNNVDKSNGSKKNGVLAKQQKKKMKKKDEKVSSRKKDKTDTENAEKDKNNTSEMRSAQESNTGGGRPEKYTHVFFHVLISEDYKFNPAKHRLVLAMEDQHGKWENMSRECKVKKKVNDHMFEFEFDLKIQTSKITQRRNIQYKYCIEQIYISGKEKYTWEHYLKDSFTAYNRTLKLDDRWRQIDDWHQYDGVIEKEPSKWDRFSNFIFSSWRTELIKHAKESVDFFSSNILQAEDSGYSVSLEQLEMLLTCYKRTYYHDGRCWDYTEDRFKQEIGGCILKSMFETAEKLQCSTEVSEDLRERQVALAIAAILTAKKLDLPFDNIKNWQQVCEHLIMHPDLAKKECHELMILEKYFPDERSG